MPESTITYQSTQVFAWMATCAQVAFLEGTIIQGLIIQNNPTYVPERWHGTLLTWAVIALPVFCNIFARRILPTLEIIGVIGHFVFFIALVTTLCVLSPRGTADFVFTTTITGLSGWKSSGIQWCIGLLSAAFPLGCALKFPSPSSSIVFC
jgi:choline transport protein